MTDVPTDLPQLEFVYPGPLRDQLVAAALSGARPRRPAFSPGTRMTTTRQSVAAWREAHEQFWTANAPQETLEDRTVVVCTRFRLVEQFSTDGRGRSGQPISWTNS